MKFVVLTDTHFVPEGQSLFGLDPAARLASAVCVINRDHPDIAFVIITGDLAHRGERPAYEHLRQVLSDLAAPVILVMGNHDRRAPFREVFPAADRDAAGFVQAVHHFDAATVVTLDTLDEDDPNHIGRLCDDRIGFLKAALRDAPDDRPLLLFQHHPPFDTGMPHMDRIKLGNPQDEWTAIARSRRPDFLFFGHVHRPIAGVWQGLPFHTQHALNHQVAFDFEASGHIPGTHEPPAYALVLVDDRQVTIHQRSFLYDGPVFSLHDYATAAAVPERA